MLPIDREPHFEAKTDLTDADKVSRESKWKDSQLMINSGGEEGRPIFAVLRSPCIFAYTCAKFLLLKSMLEG